MSFEFTALRVDLSEDLLPLSAVLHQRGVPHRIFEESGRQVLKVDQASRVEEVTSLYEAWRSGQFKIELVKKKKPKNSQAMVSWRKSPVTLALIFLSLCGFGLATTGWRDLLTFTPFPMTPGDLVQYYQGSGQYWRLITPAFLHFGWLHIAFNSLWLWEFGRRIEQAIGALNMLLLFLVIALVSNTAQFIYGGPGTFGGMSGVVYGVLGFGWVAGQLQPEWKIQPTPAIMLFMVGWLVACIVGVVSALGFGAIANEAHVGGLLSGALLGAAFGLLSGQSTK